MLQPLVEIGGHAVGLILVLVQRSGLRSAQRNGGWVALPMGVLEQIGLVDRNLRYKAVRRLVSHGLLETRSSGMGTALEYRLLPAVRTNQTTTQ